MKLKDLLAKFKIKEKQNAPLSTQPPKPVFEEKKIDIEIIQKESFSKVVVADYYTIVDYVEKMKEIDKTGINELIKNSVAWNGKRQRINKGFYYVFSHNGKLYNILINDEEISIDERTPVGEETLNKVLHFYTNISSYRYFRCIHDKNGSSYATRFYNPKEVSITAFELSREEFLRDFHSIILSLKTFDEISNILDIDMLIQIVKDNNHENNITR